MRVDTEQEADSANYLSRGEARSAANSDDNGSSGTSGTSPKLRVLHCVGHLLRGGVEMGLFNILASHDPSQFEHHVLVRTDEEEPFTAEFRKAGIPVLSCSGYRNPLKYALDLRRLVRQYGPYDILHVHGSSFSGLLTLALAKALGIRWTIVHSHNDVRPTLNEGGALHRLYVLSVLAAYRALADSGFAASVLAAESMFGMAWATDPRWEVFYYGIDCRPFRLPKNPRLRRELGLSEYAFVIGHVGRFHEQKNHAFLIDIVQAAVALNSEVVCLLIGDGPLREEIAREVSRRNLEPHFRFVHDTLSVPAYMTSAMDCFVFPSRYEGLGLVVVEAQAACLPCLISDRIPSDAIVDEALISVLPLEESPAVWASKAIQLSSSRGRPDPTASVSRVERSRFNLDASSATLCARYARFARG